MVRRKSVLATQRDILIDQAILYIQSGKYKPAYEAEKILRLPKSSVTRRASGGLSRSQSPPATETLVRRRESTS
jgi:hypothetical protein